MGGLRKSSNGLEDRQFFGKDKKRLRGIARIPKMEPLRWLRMRSLQECITKRAAQVAQHGSARRDPGRLAIAQRVLRYTVINEKSCHLKECQKEEKNRERRLRWIPKRGLAQMLSILSPTARRAALLWYCGTFQCLAREPSETQNRRILELLNRLQAMLLEPNVNAAENEEVQRTILLLRELCPPVWTWAWEANTSMLNCPEIIIFLWD